MLIFKTLLLVTSSIALTMPALAQEQTLPFEYSPIVRLMRNGQFQAEVWRRDVRTDHSELAWSNGETYATATAGMVEACTSLRKNFDATFSCSPAAPHGTAGDRAAANLNSTAAAIKSTGPGPAANPSATAAAMKSAVPAAAANPNATAAAAATKSAVPAATANPSTTAAAMKSGGPAVERKATSDASGAWLKDFWRTLERQSGGGGDGGGGGGGGGGY